jgi:hypothetical protein
VCGLVFPLTLLADLYDASVLSECEVIFSHIESKLHDWLAPPFNTSANFKNTMLRVCNSITRRLSQSQDTVFGGRILMFLAAVTPLTDKSGVNLRSNGSTNKTMFDEDAGDAAGKGKGKDGEAADADSAASGSGGGAAEETQDVKVSSAAAAANEPIDFGFYKQFWKLQRYFVQPALCLNGTGWPIMKTCTKTFLDACASLKLDEVTDQGSETAANAAAAAEEGGDEYFAKYLTSVKLFNLEQADSSFRRQILIQVGSLSFAYVRWLHCSLLRALREVVSGLLPQYGDGIPSSTPIGVVISHHSFAPIHFLPHFIGFVLTLVSEVSDLNRKHAVAQQIPERHTFRRANGMDGGHAQTSVGIDADDTA